MKTWLMILAIFTTAAMAQTKAGDAANGKRLFLRDGCYQCHGTAGQGGLAGARLAQTPLTQAAFLAFVRNSRPGGMPPYRAPLISDQELADVYVYVTTFPEPPAVKSIAILNQ